MKTLLAFSGSSRLHSLNAMLLQKGVHMAKAEGAVVETIDLRALDLPIYDGDYEASNGLPEGARTLKEAMREADGFLIASPEYNSKPTPLLLNAIDWASRPGEEDKAPLAVFRGKSAGLISASPGPLGGLRSLWALRAILQNISVTVVPTLAAVGSASPDLFEDPAFDSSNNGRRVHATLTELLRIEVRADV